MVPVLHVIKIDHQTLIRLLVCILRRLLLRGWLLRWLPCLRSRAMRPRKAYRDAAPRLLPCLLPCLLPILHKLLLRRLLLLVRRHHCCRGGLRRCRRRRSSRRGAAGQREGEAGEEGGDG